MKHIVALSGGKDSTAMALRLADVEPRKYIYVCTPTGDELPTMINHWNRLESILGQPIIKVDGVTLGDLISHWSSLPSNKARWCTRVLKIERYNAWLADQDDIISYVGLRADEQGRAGMDFDDEAITIRFPLREWGWGESDVWDYLLKRDVKIPDRTDCARCYDQTLGEWWKLWRDYPDIYSDAEKQEARISKIREKPCTFRNPKRDTWPADLISMRKRFEKGEIPRGTVLQNDFFTGGARRKKVCRACTL